MNTNNINEEDPLDFKTTAVLDDKMRQQQQRTNQPQQPAIDADAGSDEDYDDEKELKRAKKPSKKSIKKKKEKKAKKPSRGDGRKSQSARRPKKSTRARRPHAVAPKKKPIVMDSDNEDSGSSSEEDEEEKEEEEEKYVPVKRIRLTVPLIDLSEQHSDDSEEEQRAMDVLVSPVPVEVVQQPAIDIQPPSLVIDDTMQLSMAVEDMKQELEEEKETTTAVISVTHDIKQEVVAIPLSSSTTAIKPEMPPVTVVAPSTTTVAPLRKFSMPFNFGGGGLDAIDAFIQQQQVSVSF